VERRHDPTHVDRTAAVELLGVPPFCLKISSLVQNYALDRQK